MDTPDTFPPLTDDQWPETLMDMLGGFAGGLNVYRTLAHHPALVRAMSDLRGHIVNDTALGPELSEIVILRTGYRLGSTYEWSHHIVRARKRGVSDARIASMTGATHAMDPTDAAIATAVDELFDRHALSPLTREVLAPKIGTSGIFDLIATVGFYSILGYTLNSYDTPVDTDIVEALAKNPLAD